MKNYKFYLSDIDGDTSLKNASSIALDGEFSGCGRTRLRPVLLTAITTILGLLPLAIGLNIDFVGLLTEYNPNIYVGGDNNVFWKPMSWAIIFGLTFATFLTLIIVPVMYWWIERTTYKFAGRAV